MGHACCTLTFSEKVSKKDIQAKCDTWGDHNCDLGERGWSLGQGLQAPIQFRSEIFDSEEEAEKFLEEKSYGRYGQMAVRFKKYPEPKRTSAYTTLHNRLKDARRKYTEISNTPHYKGVASKTIKCKSCGSSIATEYCGKTWHNKCPVCGSDMRPASAIEKENRLKSSIKDIEAKVKAEELKQQKKQKYELYWAVACEVHC